MLEGLNEIDWGRLMGAHGGCGRLPQLLRSLVSTAESPLPPQVEEEIQEMLFHQDTPYEATPFAVPFLVEIAGADVPGRAFAMGLLGAILEFERQIPNARQIVPWSASSPPYFQTESTWAPDEDRYVRLAVLGAQSVRSGLRSYLRALAAPDQATLGSAMYLLATFDPSPPITEALRMNLLRVNDPLVRASVLWAIARGDLARARNLVDWAWSSGAPPERFVAALLLVEMGAPNSEGIELLLDCAVGNAPQTQHHRMDFAAGDTIPRALAKVRLSEEQRARLLPTLVSGFELGKRWNAEPLVEIVFPEPLHEGTPLNEMQVRVVRELSRLRQGMSSDERRHFATLLERKGVTHDLL
ncbi:MAG: hypothetical protein HOW73_46255 [Polyangiaceae bacterium]|nr:hypothetical protein [Polyangiaceae bacterium]